MTKVHCSVPERYVNPLFEVFDGGDFILSSYHDIEETDTQMQVYLADPAQAGEAARRLREALALVGSSAMVETSEVPDEDWKLSAFVSTPLQDRANRPPSRDSSHLGA